MSLKDSVIDRGPTSAIDQGPKGILPFTSIPKINGPQAVAHNLGSKSSKSLR